MSNHDPDTRRRSGVPLPALLAAAVAVQVVIIGAFAAFVLDAPLR